MKKSPEQFSSPEDKESGRPKIEMQDVATFCECNIEELSQRAFDTILGLAKHNERSEKRYREKFSIPFEVEFEEGLREVAENSIRKYEARLEETTAKFLAQAQDCFTLAYERGYVTQAEDYRIIISDKFLHFGQSLSQDTPRLNSCTDINGGVYVDYAEANVTVAHEVGHQLSTQSDKGVMGFGPTASEYLKTKDRRSVWFNEGVTMMWEKISVNDGSKEATREEDGNLYKWYFEATRLIIEKISIDDDTVYKAYFGNEEARKELDAKIEKRFGCTIEDLNCLSIRIESEFTKKIIDGQDIELTIKEKTATTVIEKIEKLAEIFSNVTVIDNRKK